jgi:hypothetical protein
MRRKFLPGMEREKKGSPGYPIKPLEKKRKIIARRFSIFGTGVA